MMLAVVQYGTGDSAAIPGVQVAGKTGTAELVDTTAPGVEAGNPANTDAWFVAFAPANRPRVAVGVELDGAGHGGETAAPAAREAMIAALKATR
jgi:cell division protein FtsI/penicillin-binding protein 2